MNGGTEEDPLLKYRAKPGWCFQKCCRLPRIIWFLIIPLIFTISVLIGFFGIFPVVVQQFVNHSKLEFTSIMITNPKRVAFNLNTTFVISEYGPTAATIGAMDLDVYYQGILIGQTSLPQLNLTGGPMTLNCTSDFSILDMKGFEAFSLALLQGNESVIWELKGETHAVIFGSSVKVNFNKKSPIPAMKGLNQIEILDFNLPANWGKGGVAIDIDISQYNPSPVGIGMGNLTLDMYYKNSFIGRVYTVNTIYPGMNYLSLNGYLRPKDLDLASEFFSNYLQGIDSEVQVVGANVNNSASWLLAMVDALSFNTIMKGAKNLTLMSDIALGSLEMVFDSDSHLFTGSTVTALFTSPFQFPLEIDEVKVDMAMYYGGVLFANFHVPFQPAISNQQTGFLGFNFSDIPLIVNDDEHMSDLVNQLVLYPSATIVIDCLGTAKVATMMGSLVFSGIHVNQEIILPGMDSFNSPIITVPSASVLSATPNMVNLQVEMNVFNPSLVNFSVTLLPIKMIYQGVQIGNVSATGFHINSNSDNNLPAETSLVRNSQNSDQITTFLSNYMQMQNTVVQIKGDPDNCPIKYMKKAMTNLVTTANVSGIQEGLITYLHMEFSLLKLLQGIIPTQITAINPWSTDVQIVSINQQVYLSNTMKNIAELIEDIHSNPIILPASGNVTSVAQPVQITGISFDEWRALIGYMNLTIIGQLGVIIGDGFEAVLQIRQDNIPASFLAPGDSNSTLLNDHQPKNSK